MSLAPPFQPVEARSQAAFTEFIEENPQYLAKPNLMDWLSDDGGRLGAWYCSLGVNAEVFELSFVEVVAPIELLKVVGREVSLGDDHLVETALLVRLLEHVLFDTGEKEH